MTRVPWWKAAKGEVHKVLFDQVHTVEQRQASYFDRFAMLECLYDPNGPAASGADPRWLRDARSITENVIQATVDTVAAAIAATDVRSRFLTDGADWSTQRRARLLEFYAEEMVKDLDLLELCRGAFYDGAKKGTGLIKIYADGDDRIRAERTMVDNIVVDDAETQNGARPRQLHYRQVDHDRDLLAYQFPEHAKRIAQAQGTSAWRRRWQRWTIPMGDTRNDVFVIESWRLPLGVFGEDGYIPGRHVICIEGADLLDEAWHKPRFPFAEFRWAQRSGSWYGISLAERIVGHQLVINKRNWQRDRQLDLIAVPTTYVRPADINARVQSHAAGNFIPIRGDFPVTVVPQAVGGEMLQDRHDAKASAFEETGVSRMAATAMKPAGLESGAALREYKDQNTQRFSMQEKGFENLVRDSTDHTLDVCKDLGAAAPVMVRRSRFGARRVPWAKVDMREVRIQHQMAAALNRTPAGRTQMVLELAQAGIINTDETRRLLQHPDLEQALSLYTASLEAIEHDLEMIEEGNYVLPEPFVNLDMAVWRASNRYLEDRDAGAPEEVLEGIRTYIVQAADMAKRAREGAAAPAGPMLPGAGPIASDPALTPPMADPMQVAAAGPAVAPMIPQLPAP